MCVLALGVMPMIGCSDTTGEGGSGGSAGANTAEVKISTQSWAPDTAREALAGVEVCETETTNCVVTDADGNATLQLPVEQETSITSEKKDYASYLDPYIIPASGISIRIPMATVQRMEDMHALVMSPYPMEGTGDIAINSYNPNEGVTFELLGTTGKLFYRQVNMDWSTELDATTSDGLGGFTEVSSGVYQVKIAGSVENCTVLGRGWPGDSAGTIKVPVQEGYASRTGVYCDEAP
jgi:hypothetical protein